jgi:hypothetical protein
MGTINQGILGGVSGTVGSVVGSSWKGISYLRGKATSYNDANTEAQKAIRVTFRKLVKLASSLKVTIIRPIWSKKAVKQTGSNLFISENFQNIDPEVPLSECPELVFSFGELPLPEGLAVQRNVAVPGGITVSWTDNSGIDLAGSNDLLRLIAVCGDAAVSITPAGIVRASETANVVLPYGAGQIVRVYVFFQNATQGIYSNDKSFIVNI